VDIEEHEIGIMRYDLVMLHGGVDETTGLSVKGRKKKISQGAAGARSVTAVLTDRGMDVFGHRFASQEPDVYDRKMPCIGVEVILLHVEEYRFIWKVRRRHCVAEQSRNEL